MNPQDTTAQPTPAGPTAGDSMDVHLAEARRRIKQLEGELAWAKHSRNEWRDKSVISAAHLAETENARDGYEKANIELRTALSTAETKAGAMDAEIKRLQAACEKEFQSVEELSGENMKLKGGIQKALATINLLTVVLANKVRRDNCDARVDACKQASETYDALSLLPPAPSVASEKEGK